MRNDAPPKIPDPARSRRHAGSRAGRCSRPLGRAGSLVLLLCLLAVGLSRANAQTQPSSTPTLFAAGTPSRFWVAQVETERDGAVVRFKTRLRERALPSGQWMDRGAMYGRAVAMTTMLSEAAVLLEDGSWKRMGESLATGPIIPPGSGPVLAWASAPVGLLAVRPYPGGLAGFERDYPPEPPGSAAGARPGARPISSAPASPSTRSTATHTAPATAPAGAVLMKFEHGRWVGLADIPADIADAAIDVGALPERIVLAAQTEPSAVRTWLLDQREWKDLGLVRSAVMIRRFDVIPSPGSLLMWLIDQDGAMRFATLASEGGWSETKPLPLSGAQPERRALAAAGGELRLVLLKDEKLWEQRYDFAGSPRDNAVELPRPASNEPNPFAYLMQFMLLVGVVLVVLAAWRRRTQDGEKPPDENEQ